MLQHNHDKRHCKASRGSLCPVDPHYFFPGPMEVPGPRSDPRLHGMSFPQKPPEGAREHPSRSCPPLPTARKGSHLPGGKPKTFPVVP